MKRDDWGELLTRYLDNIDHVMTTEERTFLELSVSMQSDLVREVNQFETLYEIFKLRAEAAEKKLEDATIALDFYRAKSMGGMVNGGAD